MKILLNEDQILEKIGVSARSLRSWRDKKVIPYIRVGRIILYDLDKVLTALAGFERRPITLK
jgi:hypothetical protein